MMPLKNPIPAPHKTISVCSSLAENWINRRSSRSNQDLSRIERIAITHAIRSPNPSTPTRASLEKEYPKKPTFFASLGMHKSKMRLSIPAAQPTTKFIRKLADNAEESPEKVCEFILQKSGMKGKLQVIFPEPPNLLTCILPYCLQL